MNYSDKILRTAFLVSWKIKTHYTEERSRIFEFQEAYTGKMPAFLAELGTRKGLERIEVKRIEIEVSGP